MTRMSSLCLLYQVVLSSKVGKALYFFKSIGLESEMIMGSLSLLENMLIAGNWFWKTQRNEILYFIPDVRHI